MFKPFYIHYNKGPGKVDHKYARGFTAKISPAFDRHACVQVAYCSPKDQFYKKAGRTMAELHQGTNVPMRKVPDMLAAFASRVEWGSLCPEPSHFNYVLRNMV